MIRNNQQAQPQNLQEYRLCFHVICSINSLYGVFEKKKEQKEDMIERDYILYISQMLIAEVMHKLWASGRAFWEQWKDFHQLQWVSDRTTYLEWSRVPLYNDKNWKEKKKAASERRKKAAGIFADLDTKVHSRSRKRSISKWKWGSHYIWMRFCWSSLINLVNVQIL